MPKRPSLRLVRAAVAGVATAAALAIGAVAQSPAHAASAVTITSGQAAGVAAGDYLLTVNGLWTAAGTYGSVVQLVNGTGAAQRNADFFSTPSAQQVSAEVRVTAPSDIFKVTTRSSTPRWSNITLTPASWGFVARGPSITSAASPAVVWHGVNVPLLINDVNYTALTSTYPKDGGVRTVVDEQCWDPFFTAGQSSSYCNTFDLSGMSTSASYQTAVRQMVDTVTSTGRMVILSVDGAGRDTPSWQPTSQTDLFGPDQQSLVVYQQLATQYANNPNVILETTNEPKMVPTNTYGPKSIPGGALWRVGGLMSLNGIAWNMPGVQDISNTIRAAGFNGLILAEGPSWGENLMPVEGNPIVGTNIGLAFHGYRSPDNQTTYPPAWNNIIKPLVDPNGTYAYSSVLTEFGTVQSDSVLGARGSNYLQSCINWVHDLGLGWLAHAWYPVNLDHYGLLNSLQPLSLTSRGQTVVKNF